MNEDIIRVLFVDDSRDDYVFISHLLNRAEGTHFEVEWSADYDDAMEKTLLSISVHI